MTAIFFSLLIGFFGCVGFGLDVVTDKEVNLVRLYVWCWCTLIWLLLTVFFGVFWLVTNYAH